MSVHTNEELALTEAIRQMDVNGAEHITVID